MIAIRYNPADSRYIFITGDTPDIKKLEKYLNQIPEYQFLPSFSGPIRPEVFLNKMMTKSGYVIHYCFVGLYKTIYDWCIKNGIRCEGLCNELKYTGFKMTLEEFQEYINGWGLNITPRDYQVKAAWVILHYRQSLSELATRFGKTLVAYIVFRFLLENGCRKILYVVPNVTLIKQAVADLSEYKEFFSTETVWTKGEGCDSPNLTIGTFQSLVKRADPRSKHYNTKWFNQFDVVLVDEAHHLVCDSISKILNLPFLKNVKLRFGFTGTLPKEDTIESFCCHSLMGPTVQVVTPSELIEEGYLARPKITQVRIQYDDTPELTKQYIKFGEYLCSNFVLDENKKKIRLPAEERDFTMIYKKELPYTLAELKGKYTDEEYREYLIELCKGTGANLLSLEQMIIHHSPRRIEVMRELLMGLDKNCIVFAHHSAYIKYIRDYLVQMFPDRNVYVIDGPTPIKKREEIIKKLEVENGSILVASYGVCSTGLTLKNMDYAIFAQSFKSDIIVNQSLGRLMLKTSEKDEFYLYDLIDCLPTKRLYTQGLAKVRTYKEHNYECIIKKA